MVDIGEESFFADGIYLAGPRVSRGSVTLAYRLPEDPPFERKGDR